MTIYRFTTKMISQQQECRNVWYFDLTAETTPVKQSVVDGLSNALKTRVQTGLSTLFNFYGVDVQRADTEGYPSEQFVPTGGNWSGTNATQALANQTAVLLSFMALSTPPNRVRKYIPGQVTGGMSGGIWSGAHISSFDLVISDVIALDGLTDVTGPYSVRYSSADPATVLASNKVTQGVTRSIPATQRRRRVGVGI